MGASGEGRSRGGRGPGWAFCPTSNRGRQTKQSQSASKQREELKRQGEGWDGDREA